MLDKANNFIRNKKFTIILISRTQKNSSKNDEFNIICLKSNIYILTSFLISSAQKYSQDIPEQKHYG